MRFFSLLLLATKMAEWGRYLQLVTTERIEVSTALPFIFFRNDKIHHTKEHNKPVKSALTFIINTINMRTLFSCSNKLAKWLKVDLDRIESLDGKKIGTQTIQSGSNQIAFQLQGFEQKEQRFILAAEASTKFCFIIPLTRFEELTAHTLQHKLFAELFNISIYLIQEITKKSFHNQPQAVNLMMKKANTLQFNTTMKRNTDMSLGAMLSDTQHWINNYIDQHGLDSINENTMLDLSMYLNSKPKKSINWNLPVEHFTALVMNTFYSPEIDALFDTQTTDADTIHSEVMPNEAIPDKTKPNKKTNTTHIQNSDNVIDFQAFKDRK